MAGSDIHVLHVDDQPDFLEMTAEFLEREEERFEITTATSAQEGIELIQDREFDCVVSDYQMPGTNGLEFLESVRELDGDLPFVLFTGKGSEEIASEAISSGVSDYQRKVGGPDQFAVLANRVKNLVEQYRARLELEETREHADSILETSPDMVAVARDDELVFVNEAGVELLHATDKSALLGSSPLDVIDEDEREELRREMARVESGRESEYRAEHTVRRRDGSTFPAEYTAAPIQWGGTNAVLVIVRDVTERKARERELRRYERIVESMNDGAWILDADRELVFVNQTITERLGLSKDELLGRRVAEVLEGMTDPETVEAYQDYVDAVLAGERVDSAFELEMDRQGETAVLEIRLVPFEVDGRVEGVVGVSRDVTGRKNREKELAHEKSLLDSIFEQAPVHIYVKDQDAKHVRVASTYVEDPEQFIGKTDIDLYEGPSAEETYEDDLRVIEDGEVIINKEERVTEAFKGFLSEETYTSASDASSRDAFDEWVLTSKVPWRNDDGDIVGLIGVTFDISEYKRREVGLKGLHDVATDLENCSTAEEACELTITAAEEILAFDLCEISLEEDGYLVPHASSQEIDAGAPETASVEEGIGGKTYRNRESYLIEDASEHPEAKPQGPFESAVSVPIGDAGVFQAVSNRPGFFDETDLELTELLVSHTAAALERIRREEQLHERESELAYKESILDSLFEQVPVHIYVKDEDARHIYASRAFAEQFGEPDLVPGKRDIDLTFLENVSDEHLQASYEDDMRVINTGVPILDKEEHNEPTDHWLLTSKVPWRDDDGNVVGLIGVTRDITARKKREQELQQERDRFAALFENIPEPAAVVEFEGGKPIVRQVNTEFERVFGFAGDELRGENLDAYVVPAGKAEESRELNATLQAGENVQVEVRRRTADGMRDFLLHVVPVKEEPQDEPEGYAIYSDITERKQRERELRRQNERLESFARLVSHDLRSPLNVAQGRLELVEEDCESEHLADVRQAQQRIGTLIEDLLTLAREGKTVDSAEPIDVETLFDECWQNVVTDEATLTVETGGVIDADAKRLQNLVENLYRNAVEHGGEGASVRVGVTDDGFYVEDDGVGIPEAVREKVFEMGYTTGENGTGLGLPIVREIAEAHGWQVSVGESDDGGARIEFSGVRVRERDR